LKNKKNSCSLAKETKKILQKYDIQLNKNLGQNYLIDDFKRKKIIEFAQLNKKDIVLEIGPGIGTLTTELAKKSKKVVAIEQDPNIFNILEKRLKNENINNVQLINDDAVKTDFPKFNKIVSNLPYQISSPITFKFLKYPFDLAILMYQKEFGKRMIAKYGSKNYSRLSAMLYFKGEVEILDNVSPESFIPKPKIDSVVLKLNPKQPENFNISTEEFKNYEIICKALFQHKNKKSKNALIDSRQVLGYTDKKELKEQLNLIDAEYLFTERAVNMSPEKILKLSKELKNVIKN
jgi:16S rRNA (adenine1518-N6/adenine1519-N6)-dimethyltransferase